MRRSGNQQTEYFVQFGAVMTACVLLVSEVRGVTPRATHGRSFNGVTANFEITNPLIKKGEDLKLVVVYHNAGPRAVTFRFFPAEEDAKLYRKGESKPI